ncbi:hypothetical protein D3C81_1892490 [compost metagenome]
MRLILGYGDAFGQQAVGQLRGIEQLQAHDLAHFVDVERAGIEQLDHALNTDLLEVGFALFDTARGHQDQLVEQLRFGQPQANGDGATQGVAE